MLDQASRAMRLYYDLVLRITIRSLPRILLPGVMNGVVNGVMSIETMGLQSIR